MNNSKLNIILVAIFDSWNMLRKENNLFLTHYFDPYDIVKDDKLDGILNILNKNKVNTKLYKDLL